MVFKTCSTPSSVFNASCARSFEAKLATTAHTHRYTSVVQHDGGVGGRLGVGHLVPGEIGQYQSSMQTPNRKTQGIRLYCHGHIAPCKRP